MLINKINFTSNIVNINKNTKTKRNIKKNNESIDNSTKKFLSVGVPAALLLLGVVTLTKPKNNYDVNYIEAKNDIEKTAYAAHMALELVSEYKNINDVVYYPNNSIKSFSIQNEDGSKTYCEFEDDPENIVLKYSEKIDTEGQKSLIYHSAQMPLEFQTETLDYDGDGYTDYFNHMQYNTNGDIDYFYTLNRGVEVITKKSFDDFHHIKKEEVRAKANNKEIYSCRKIFKYDETNTNLISIHTDDNINGTIDKSDYYSYDDKNRMVSHCHIVNKDSKDDSSFEEHYKYYNDYNLEHETTVYEGNVVYHSNYKKHEE